MTVVTTSHYLQPEIITRVTLKMRSLESFNFKKHVRDANAYWRTRSARRGDIGVRIGFTFGIGLAKWKADSHFVASSQARPSAHGCRRDAWTGATRATPENSWLVLFHWRSSWLASPQAKSRLRSLYRVCPLSIRK